MEQVLGNIGSLLEKEMKIKTSVKSATLYPKIVIFVLLCASVVIMTFVMPKFESFFAHYKSELPLPTKIMIWTSSFIHNFWYMLIIAGVGVMTAYKKYAATAKGKLRLGDLAFRLPVFGPLNTKVANSRFCHILSALYRSGLPINRCLEIAGATIDNGAFAREMDVLRAEVTRGRTLSESMAECTYFTPVIIDATAVGEKTGALDEMLESMGLHYDLEVEHSIKNLTTMLEPMLLGGIFGIVTVFMLAIFLPMWNMSAIVGKH
ncbi:MAG: type II secretion system F family protein [Deltaproteobacteria bacterium]|nr:MAG: type II secretion system F family protein [Deltaproteobacteria bacterium]